MNRGIFLLVAILLISSLAAIEDANGQKRRYRRPPPKEYKITHYRGGRVNDLRGGQRNLFVSFSVNAMNYFGDIAPAPKKLSTDMGFTRAGFGVTMGKRFHPHMAWRFSFNYGKLKGDDLDTADPTEENSLGRFQRNLHFENVIKEFSGGLEIDLFPNRGGAAARLPINPYIFIGAAIFHHQPKAVVPTADLQGNSFSNAGQLVNLRELGTEGQNIGGDSLPGTYSNFQLAIPIGIGIKVKIMESFDAHLEFGLRQLFFDYIDDVSRNYVDLGLLDSELARALADRGAEPTSALSGEVRDPNFFTVRNFRASNDEVYQVGINYEPNGVRGGSKDNDFYLITSLKFVYYITQKNVRRGKFR